MVVPGKISTQGYSYTHIYFSYKWKTFQGVVVKDRMFLSESFLLMYVAFKNDLSW